MCACALCALRVREARRNKVKIKIICTSALDNLRARYRVPRVIFNVPRYNAEGAKKLAPSLFSQGGRGRGEGYDILESPNRKTGRYREKFSAADKTRDHARVYSSRGIFRRKFVKLRLKCQTGKRNIAEHCARARTRIRAREPPCAGIAELLRIKSPCAFRDERPLGCAHFGTRATCMQRVEC